MYVLQRNAINDLIGEDGHFLKIEILETALVGLSLYVESGSSVVECRTRNKVSPGSNPPLLPFGRLGIFLLSIDAPVDSAV